MVAAELIQTWQMWATFALVLCGVILYATERFSIEATSVGILTAIIAFSHSLPLAAAG